MPQPQDLLTATDKGKNQRAKGLARFQALMAQTKAQLEAQKANMVYQQTVQAADDSTKDALAAAKQKLADQREAAKGKGEAATSNLPEITNQQLGSGAAGVQGGGDTKGLVDSFATGPEGPQSQLPGVPGAPPFLTDTTRTSEVGPRDLGLGITMPMRTTRQSTNVRPNAMGQGERVRALQENYRQQQAQRAAQQQQVQATIATEAEDLGGTIFSESQGEVDKGATKERFKALEAQYGKEMATRIVIGAKASARGLEMERQKSQFQSDLIEGRAKRGEGRRAAQRKSEKSGAEARPSAQAKDKVAEIQMGLLEGKKPTKEEQAFVDAYNKSNPLDIAVRNAFTNATAGGKKPTQADADRVSESTGITDPTELRSRMEAMGYVFE